MGLVLLASVSLAPTSKRIPVIGSDGLPMLDLNGRVITEFDTAYYWSINWFGISLLILAAAIFVWLLLRLIWSCFAHLLRDRCAKPPP